MNFVRWFFKNVCSLPRTFEYTVLAFGFCVGALAEGADAWLTWLAGAWVPGLDAGAGVAVSTVEERESSLPSRAQPAGEPEALPLRGQTKTKRHITTVALVGLASRGHLFGDVRVHAAL